MWSACVGVVVNMIRHISEAHWVAGICLTLPQQALVVALDGRPLSDASRNLQSFVLTKRLLQSEVDQVTSSGEGDDDAAEPGDKDNRFILPANSPAAALKLRLCSVFEKLMDACSEARLSLLLHNLKPADGDTVVYVKWYLGSSRNDIQTVFRFSTRKYWCPCDSSIIIADRLTRTTSSRRCLSVPAGTLSFLPAHQRWTSLGKRAETTSPAFSLTCCR